MKYLNLFFCLSALMIACTGTNQKSPDMENLRGLGSDFEIQVTAIDHGQNWQPASGTGFAGITLTRGVSMTMANGSLSGFQSEPGYEIVVVHVHIKRLADRAMAPLETVRLEDAKGNEYQCLINNPSPLGRSAGEDREFPFSVPVGEELKAVHIIIETLVVPV